jgi:O-antigen ligase
MTGPERILAAGLAAVLLLAPLPFGAVEGWAGGALAGCCLLLGALWVAWRGATGETPLPWREPVLIVGTAFLLYALFQALPLPRHTLLWLSPETVALRDTFGAGGAGAAGAGATGPAGAGGAALSLYPAATWRAALRFAGFLVVALASADLAVRSRGRRWLVGALAAAGGFQAMYGLAEFVTGRQQIFGYVKKHYTDVATGTFINRNHFAGYLEMTLPIAMALAAAAVSRLRREAGAGPGVPDGRAARLARVSGRSLFAAAMPFLLCLVMLAALVCSRSRGGIASALAATAVVAVAAAWRGRGRSFAVAAAVALAGFALVLGQSGAGPLVERFSRSLESLRGPYGRMEMWSQAAAVAGRFPAFGVGVGAFPYVFPMFRTAGEGVGLAHAHNDYLEIAAETGVAGGLLLAAGLGAAIVAAARAGRGRADLSLPGCAAAAGVLAIALHSLADFNLAIPANSLTVAALCGLLLAWRRRAAPVVLGARSVGAAPAAVDPRAAGAGNRAAPRAAGGRRALIPAGLLAGLGIAAFLPVPASADRQFERAAAAAREPVADLQALAHAAAAGALPSASAIAYLTGRLDEAIAVHDDGLRRLPFSARGHLQRARLRLARCAAAALAESPGSAAAAEGEERCIETAADDLRIARRLRPMSRTVRAEADAILAAVRPALGGDGQ